MNDSHFSNESSALCFFLSSCFLKLCYSLLFIAAWPLYFSVSTDANLSESSGRGLSEAQGIPLAAESQRCDLEVAGE